MPELPEVETVVRSLQPLLPGRTIQNLEVHWPRSLHDLSPAKLWQKVRGRTIKDLKRRAKLILIALSDGAWLALHLRMTGRLYPVDDEKLKKVNAFHISIIFFFSDGSKLVFEDQRRFGRLYYFKNQLDLENYLSRYGPEPLDKNYKSSDLFNALQQHKRQLKALLLDQSFLAGLGNIYVDEALWLAKLHPCSRSHTVHRNQAALLHSSIRKILHRSIESNGTTFMNFKFLGGQAGGYTNELLVFRQTGQACKRCGDTIQKIVVSQRSTHICPTCQRPT